MEPKPRAGAEMELDRSGQGKKYAAKYCLPKNFFIWMGKSQVIALLKAQDLGDSQGWEMPRLEFKLFHQSLKGKLLLCQKEELFLKNIFPLRRLSCLFVGHM